jgi:hypothetical protein
LKGTLYIQHAWKIGKTANHIIATIVVQIFGIMVMSTKFDVQNVIAPDVLSMIGPKTNK